MRRRSKNDKELSESSASELSESSLESSSEGEGSDVAPSSGNDRSLSSASDGSEQSSAPSNQTSDPDKPRGERRKSARRRQATRNSRSKRHRVRSQGQLAVHSRKESSWSARERQFEKFRSAFIVLPVPDSVTRIEKARGYSFLVKSVVNWVVPEPILSSASVRGKTRTSNIKTRSSEDEAADDDEDDEDDDLLLTLGVHVSLFHAPSKRFFGNTWVSPEICIDGYQIKPSRDPKSNAVRHIVENVSLNVRAYFLSEIVDPNCVGIVELVAYRKDPDSKATMAAAGCGWSILPLFVQSVGEAAPPSSHLSTPFAPVSSSGEAVGVFLGSPRVLWEVQNAAEWQTLARHEQCKFHYQLQQYDPLLTLGTSGFVRRNELVGALEVIPGLKHGNLAGIDAGTNPKLLLLRDSGSGDDEEDDIAAYEDALSSFARMASLVPKTIQVEECFTLNAQAIRVFMHMRSEVETNLISRVKLSRRTIYEGASSIDDGHISARVLKLALHNGRCFRTRQHTIPLKVDETGGGDDIMRCAQSTPARLKGFVFHPYMAVVVSLQFTVHFRVTWPPKLKQQAMEAKPMKVLPEDDSITVTMASRIVVPSDGKKLFLYDKEHPSNSNQCDDGATDPQRVLHVDLLSGPSCRPYTENAVYTPPDHMMGASRTTQAKFRESIAFADLVLTVDGDTGAKGKNREAEIVNSADKRPPQAAEHWAKRILAKADANSVLAQTLNALATTTSLSASPQQPPGSPKKPKEERGTSPVRPASPLKKQVPDHQDPVPIAPSAASLATELSRASKTLLMRYGFVDAHDTNAVAATGKHATTKAKTSVAADVPKCMRHELEDIYKVHEIRLHFAAFRVLPDSPLTRATLPTRLYFTFQFYRFAPTRTETLRLSNSFASTSTVHGSGQTFLLMRESPANKPSLAIQYDVDSTLSQNPLEHREFASYLLTKQLYVDVWDADSLFLLGTCAIPLHELLRQGAGVKKFQGEVDVWEPGSTNDVDGTISGQSETSARDEVQHTELTEIKQPRTQGRHAIGKLQILLSNYGLKGRNGVGPSASTSRSERHGTAKSQGDALTMKAKHRVRARPLVDNNDELYRLLADQGFYGERAHGAETSAHHRQHRQLLKARSTGDATTLSTSEIDILCELFRANPQGSAPHATRIACDREGKRGLTALLSLKPPAHQPSKTPERAAVPPLQIAHAMVPPQNQDPVTTLRAHLQRVLERAIDKGVHIHQVFMDFDASGDGNLSYDELERALGQLGVDTRPNDSAAKANMRRLLSQFDKDGDGFISYEEFLLSLGISIEQNKKEVIHTATVDMESAVRDVFQRLEGKGFDVEELFDHFDADKNGSLDMRELKKALEQCLKIESSERSGNLLALLNEDALRALMQRVNKNGDDIVDYHEFLTFLGVVRRTPREEKMKKRVLSQAERKLIKLLLRAMRMGMSVKQLFHQFDSNSDGDISIREFANSLDALFQTKSSLSEDDIGVITKRFDANGDGHISYAEFKGFVEEIRTAQDNLTRVFQPIVSRGELAQDGENNSLIPLAQWTVRCGSEWNLKNADIGAAVLWMEAIDLVDDKQRVNVQEFLLVVTPPSSTTERQHPEKKEVGIRLREFLQHSVREGVDARACFAHFDPDGDGEITAAELKQALRQLGRQFDDVTDRAIDAMVDEIDTDGSGKISFAEFERLLPASARKSFVVDPTKPPVQKSDEVLSRLSQLLASAAAKGMDIDACFGHFDKDKNGTITREEFVLAMQELGMSSEDGDEVLPRVMDQIDRDRSGEISLAEFKRLFPHSSSTPVVTPREGPASTTTQKETSSCASTASKAIPPALDRLRALLRSAEQGGVSIKQSFEHFDVDNDGTVTRDEFTKMIKALPGFEDVSESDISNLLTNLDANGSDTISLDEFQDFIQGSGSESTGTKAPAPVTSSQATAVATSETKEAGTKEITTKMTKPVEADKGGPTEGKEAEPKSVSSDGDGDASAPSGDSVDRVRTGESDEATVKDQKPLKESSDDIIAAERGATKPKLQRAGSFSGGRPANNASVKTIQRASTDSESVAEETRKSMNNAAKAEPSKNAPTGRRPSLAETRAAAKKAMSTKAVTDETTLPNESGDVAVAEKPAEAKKTAPPVRRPSLAEARAAAKAAKTGAIADTTEGAAKSPTSLVASEDQGSLQERVALVDEQSTDSKPGGEVVDSKKNSARSDGEPQASVTETTSNKTPVAAEARAGGSAARRPSLAETRATARAAAKAPAGPAGKPPLGESSRRPSLAETRAAAAAAKAKKDMSSSPAPISESTEVQHGLANLQSLLQQAQTGGVDLPTALKHFDKDENGKLSYDEFISGLKALGSDLTNVQPDAARSMAQYIDMTGKGHITLQDFEVFIQTPLTTSTTAGPAKPKEETKPVGQPSTPQSTNPRLPRSGSLTARAVSKGPVTRSIASESEAGSVTSRTASSLSKTPIAKHTVTNKEPPPAKPLTQPGSAPAMASSDRQDSPREPDGVSDGPPASDYECSYEFHSDPAIRSVEVKLRRAAIDAYSRGVLPLRLVHKCLDSSSGGSKAKSGKSELRRVEFLQLLMEMGFSLLSDTNDGADEDDGAAENGMSHGPRMHDQLYARQLERLARYKHHIKEESRAEKALVRAVHQVQERAQKHSKKAKVTSAPSSSVSRFVQDKSQLMRVLSYYRDGHKKSLVYSLLRDQVTTQVVLFPSFAALLFAEMPFVNPYPHQERFRLEFLTTPSTVDADIVKSSEEWRFYRRHVPLSFGELPSSATQVDNVEHDMIDPHNEVVMDANDQIVIPMKLRWLQPTTVATNSAKASATMSLAVRSCTHGHTVALFKLDLFAQPFVCHRVLRFVNPASSVWKWTVRCPQGKHLVCLDPSVAAVVESSPTGAATLVTLKCRVGAYPSLEDFFVVVYDDEYFARIDEVWQIRIQAAMRLDVHTLLGQTVRSELVIRGDGGPAPHRTRHVRCFTTWHHARQVSFRPAQIFQLVGDAYNRIEWRFCATEMPAALPALSCVRVHLVDVETHELLGCWLLHVSLGRPTVTKSYELRLPATQAAQKKIAYANPWDQSQTVVLRSSDPARMRPRDSVLQIPPQGQIFLRLVFPAPQAREGDGDELLLFVNDQQTEQVEECLRFQVSYN